MVVYNDSKSRLNSKDLTIIQSKTIDFLRFPLVIMVVFLHMNPKVVALQTVDFDYCSWHGIYNFVGILFTHTLPAVAVPAFFFISGFLFFLNIPEWSWDKYHKKIINRIKTLIIPYIIWNILAFILSVFIMFILVGIGVKMIDDVLVLMKKCSWHILYDCSVWGEKQINWLGDHLRMTGPYDHPLWFLRDLIVITLLSPLVFYIVKQFKIYVIIVLFFAYISRIWLLIPGFNISAWFFFSVGAYFAINKINIIRWTCKYALLFIPLSIILLSFSIAYDGVNTVIGQNILPLYVCAGVPSIIYLAGVCVSKFKLEPNKFLVSSCFFIYAFHLVPLASPLYFTSKVLLYAAKCFSGQEILSYFNQLFVYLISPFVTILICLFILVIGRRLFPNTTMLLSGNR